MNEEELPEFKMICKILAICDDQEDLCYHKIIGYCRSLELELAKDIGLRIMGEERERMEKEVKP